MIPDYIIYDEMKRRRAERERDQRVQLEVPLYRPRLPISEPPGEDDDAYDDTGDRGVFIIDINDLFEDDEDEDDED